MAVNIHFPSTNQGTLDLLLLQDALLDVLLAFLLAHSN